MRVMTAMLLSMLVFATGYAQKVATPEEVITRIINTGISEGFDQKIIGGLGDDAAVVITKVVGERALTARQSSGILVVLNSAFAGSKLPPEREPRTALFLLRCLEQSTNDSDLRKRIVETRHYIQEQFAKANGARTPTHKN